MGLCGPIVIKNAPHYEKYSEHNTISLVARVINVTPEKFKIVYKVRDITGEIAVVLWLNEEVPAPEIKKNDYVQIFGMLTTENKERQLLAFKVLPVTDINEITSHYLRCIYTKFMKYNKKELFNYIQNSVLEEGVTKADIIEEFKKKMAKMTIEYHVRELYKDGYIYHTIDEDHYKDTRSFDDVGE